MVKIIPIPFSVFILVGVGVLCHRGPDCGGSGQGKALCLPARGGDLGSPRRAKQAPALPPTTTAKSRISRPKHL